METIVQICEHNRIKIYVRMLTNVCVLDTHTHTHTHKRHLDLHDHVYTNTHTNTNTRHLDFHVFRLLRLEGLRSEDVLNLRGTNAERQRTEGAVRRRVAVTAHNGGAGESEALGGNKNKSSKVSGGWELYYSCKGAIAI